MQTAPRFLTSAELELGFVEVLASPGDLGTLESIVVRPAVNERRTLTKAQLSPERGVDGDRWANEPSPDPAGQVSIMNARILRQISTEEDAVCLAGDNLIVDFDLSETNAPPGTRLAIGKSVVIEINGVPHTGCGKFQKRYGQEARAFINSERGTQLHLRGRYACVVAGGTINVGDAVRKV
jgi:MOSC domain-containing protein YiiM